MEILALMENPAHTVGPYDMYDKILGGFGMILLPRGSPYGDDKCSGSSPNCNLAIERIDKILQ